MMSGMDDEGRGREMEGADRKDERGSEIEG